METTQKRERKKIIVKKPVASAKPGQYPVLRKVNDSLNRFVKKYGWNEYKWASLQIRVANL